MLSSLEEEELISFNNEFDFSSMLNYYAEDFRDSIGVYDDLLAALLNPNGKIQIGDTLFCLDFIRDTLIAINTRSLDTIRRISIFEEYWDEDLPTEVNPSKSESTDILKAIYTYECGMTKVKSKIAYQRAGIYYSLIVKSTDKSALYVINGALKEFDTSSGCYYRKKNHNSDTTIPRTHKSTRGNSISFRVGQGPKRIKKFLLSADFYVNPDDITVSYFLSINKS